MAEPLIAQKAPFEARVEAGRTYWWCACGRSARQPFCDGSHKETGFEPVKHVAATTGTLWFCGCKRTAGPPLCDGHHNSL
jgi:CDGSH-type Zn-finger protein